ncbi:MAG: GAF domain-containing protein, partial [Chloroflexi bacterium]
RTITAQLAISLQNLRLLERTQQDAQRLEEQVRVLNAINEVSNTLNQVRDTRELVKQVTKALVDVLQIDHAGIVLINPDRKTGTVAGEYPDKGATGFTLSAEGALWDRLRNKESIVINDVDNAEGLPEGSREALQATGVKSVMFVPLQDIDGSLLGSVGLDIYRPNFPFTPRMAEVAETITSQVAIGLQNINLFSSTQRYAQQLEIIARFNQSIEATSPAREIYLQALKTLGDMVDADHAAIYLYDEDRDHLRTIALLAEGKQSVDMVSGEVYTLDGILGDVWNKGVTVYIEDTRDEQLDFRVDTNIQALMIAPLKVGNKTIGLISLGAYQSYIYQQTDLAVFRQFVNQIGVAIENAEAYAKSERTALSKTLANEISALIQQQVDLNSILQVTMGELGRALHAKRGRIRLGAQAIEASDGKRPSSNGDHAT